MSRNYLNLQSTIFMNECNYPPSPSDFTLPVPPPLALPDALMVQDLEEVGLLHVHQATRFLLEPNELWLRLWVFPAGRLD